MKTRMKLMIEVNQKTKRKSKVNTLMKHPKFKRKLSKVQVSFYYKKKAI